MTSQNVQKGVKIYWIKLVVDRALKPGPGPGRALDVRPKPGPGRASQKPGPGTGPYNSNRYMLF